MKTTISIFAVLTLALGVAYVTPGEAEEPAAPAGPQYIGVDGCGTCHKREKKGNQLGKWQESRHAKAYETLATSKADSLYAVRRSTAVVAGAAQKAGECLQCHVTPHGVDAARIATPKKNKVGLVATDGVGCESCHGPGGDYKSRKIMKDRDTAVAAGLVIPDEALCLTCHNDKSPTFSGFDFAEMSAKIAHPYPEAPAE